MKILDEILTYKSLAFKHGDNQSALMDDLIDVGAVELPTTTKNVGAHLALPLVDRLESALGVLDMSKRQFIEAAIIDALDRFDVIAESHEIFQPHFVKQETQGGQ